MDKHIYRIGSFIFVFVISVLPASAFAHNGSSESVNGNEGQASVSAQLQTTSGDKESGNGTETGVRGGKDLHSSDHQQKDEQSVHKNEDTKSSVSSDEKSSDGINSSEHVGNVAGQDLSELENDEAPVGSLTALKQRIEKQTKKLNEVVASTTSPVAKASIEHANNSRIATNSLIVSKKILGNVGQKVSTLAKEVKQSVATTTIAEAKIQSRGFFTKLLFGGDTTAANIITKVVSKNQKTITQLNQLLAQANIAPDIKTILNAQIAALETAQTRLQNLAKQEQGMWGIFSWRF